MKKVLISLFPVLLLILISACGRNQIVASTWQDQYDLGVRYLSEGNYEDAIIAFTAAIEIDPRQVQAYIGRSDAYIVQADKLDNTADAYELYQKAMEGYEQAVSLGSDDAQEKIDALQIVIRWFQANIESEPLLKALYPLFSSDDLGGAVELMRQNEYRAMSAAVAEEPFIYFKEEGICLAVYADNCYYFGQWDSGQREGHGLWLQAALDDNSDIEYRQYEGAWSNDLPNGDGEITIIKDLEHLQLKEGYTTSIHTTIKGTFKNGLYHGTIYETWNMNSEDTHIWTAITAVNGIYQAMRNVPDEIKDSDHYRKKIAEGSYIVAVDQLNNSTELWNGGSINRVFGLERGQK